MPSSLVEYCTQQDIIGSLLSTNTFRQFYKDGNGMLCAVHFAGLNISFQINPKGQVENKITSPRHKAVSQKIIIHV